MNDYLTSTTPCTQDVWRALTDALHAFIGRRLQDAAGEKRVMQETLLHVQRDIAALRPGERVGAWIYQVAQGHVAEHQRRQSAGALLFEAAAAPPPDDSEQVQRELASLIEACVAALPDTYREALLLAELEALAQPAVAKRLGLSLTSAKQRIQRGEQRLRELLVACCTHELATAA